MKNHSLAHLAQVTGAQLVGHPDHLISGVDNLETATSCEASFLENPKYVGEMQKSGAGVIVVHPSTKLVEGKNYLLHPQPSLAFQQIVYLFLPKISSGFSGIHPTAVIHPQAIVAQGVTVGPHVVIDRGAQVGAKTVLEAGTVICAEASVGEDCHFYPHAIVREGCVIGNRVTLQPGAIIGSCGFGYHTDEKGKHTKLEQRGRVVIEDDVEIGANTTIDRARFKETRIRKGSKIDNLVQIAHQVDVGEDNLIVSQVGIAGSTRTGKNVVIGGQVGVVGHATLADGVMLAARAAVSKSLTKGGIYSGAPAIPIHEFNEQFVLLRNIKKLVARVKKLEESLEIKNN